MLLAVATIGTVAFGYYVGYDSEPDLGDATFLKALDDANLWSSIEHDWRKVFHLARALRIDERVDTELAKSKSNLAPSLQRAQDELAIKKANERASANKLLEKVFEVHPEIRDQALQ